MSASIFAAFQSAGNSMAAAAQSISTGDLDGYVDASVEMSEAKMETAVGVQLSRAEDAAFQNLLDITV